MNRTRKINNRFNIVIIILHRINSMPRTKRGPYYNYLRCVENETEAKIPRQTAWNQKKKVFEN